MGAEPVEFGGDLALLSVFDLGQLLMLNRATGRLTLFEGERKGRLFFQDGRIINAVDEASHEGPLAAYRLFAWKSGRFDFRPEAPGGAPLLIRESTESLMLEAARRMDEAAELDAPTETETERLLGRRAALDELREAFGHVAREATGRRQPWSGGSPATLLDVLREAEDRLVVRPDRSPRLFCGGIWCAASESVLDPAGYQSLKQEMLAPAAGSGPESREAGGATHTIRIDAEHAFAVTAIGNGPGEALWIRRIAVRPPDATQLAGPLERLGGLIDQPEALILVGGPEASTTELLFHSVVALTARRRAGALLLVADVPAFDHADESGAVLQVTPAEAAAAQLAVRPDVVALEAACADPAFLRAMSLAPLVLAAITAQAVEAMPARWSAILRAAGLPAEAACAGRSRVGFVFGGRRDAEGRIAFDVRAAKPQGAGHEPAAEPQPLDP